MIFGQADHFGPKLIAEYTKTEPRELATARRLTQPKQAVTAIKAADISTNGLQTQDRVDRTLNKVGHRRAITATETATKTEAGISQADGHQHRT